MEATQANQCAYCAAPISQPATGRPRKFCSNACKFRFRRKGGPAPTLPVQAPVRQDTRHTENAPASSKAVGHQFNGLEAKREADRLRKRTAARGKFGLATEALRQWQEANPAEDIEAWCQANFATPFLAHWQAPRYIRDFVRCAYYAPTALRQVFLSKGAQLGFTSALQALTAFGVCRGKRHVVLAQPTAQDAQEFRRDAITPLFENIQELALLSATVRGDQSTTTHRVFAESSVRIQGGIKPGRWRRFVADLVAIDERDAMPQSATSGAHDEGEGDVVTLAMRALQNRGGRLVAGGTPTSAHGASRIRQEAATAALPLVYVVKCPVCGELDDVAWEKLAWPSDAPSKDAAAAAVAHHCGQCGAAWKHERLANAIEGGRWVESETPEGAPFAVPVAEGRWLDPAKPCIRNAAGEEQPWPRSVGFQTHSVLSPWRAWPELIAHWLSCQSDPAKMQAFVEQQLGREYGKAVEGVDEAALRAKRQPIALDAGGLPPEAEHVIVAVDVQKDWLSVLTTAWARPDRGWVLARDEFHGGVTPPSQEAWTHWAAWMRERWATCRTSLTVAVDAGYWQSVVLGAIRTLCARRELPRGRVQYMACKGAPLSAPVFRMSRHGPRLAIVGASVKPWQFAALEKGGIVVADTLGDDVLRELAAEQIRRTRRGTPEVKATGPNEASDCLSYAAGIWLGRMGNTL